ncbi:uncharacterized protein Z518_09889 [Rhinocladiella mackenziei CBS 650.93]|uniref:Class II aldolase/adducin N-terminal domain-containing protein n=1 Tax=Rhinocladiella mackenziei CBS 650.93 TaxID=1442369 RepID=A0A0D2I4U1_9EURO|nr:uncharacterized protein Z518_09889 [Rhinocladiella mackenziei CBS 650.93]KIX00824.1 hypothetical protein Z518_09889 [Rhinocladiella mackenziei CBS 650.93]
MSDLKQVSEVIYVMNTLQRLVCAWNYEDDFSQFLRDLIAANHIIHDNGVVDTFGHISSARQQTWLSIAWEIVLQSMRTHREASSNDIFTRELYKRYPDVNCVIHSHADDVLPQAVSGVPLKPVCHMTGFLASDTESELGCLSLTKISGLEVPIYDIEEFYPPGESHDLLVDNARLGAHLASKFCSQKSTPSGKEGRARPPTC